MTRLTALIAIVAALVVPGAPASAQDAAANYPSGLVRIVASITPGSAADVLARAAAEKLSQKWGQQVIVENRPGAAGTASVANAAPDGTTLMLNANGFVVLNETNPNLPFNTQKDFVGIAKLASLQFVLVTPPDRKYATLGDLIAAAKAKPGTLNYASSGLGSTSYLAAVLFTQAADVQMQHVPYRGGPEAVTSVMRGDADAFFATPFATRDLIAVNKLRALALAWPTRAELAPDVPTFAEAGLPNFKYDAWFGMFAPAGVPQPIIDKVSRDLIEAFADPEVISRLAEQGLIVSTLNAAEFNALLKSDTERFVALLRNAAK